MTRLNKIIYDALGEVDTDHIVTVEAAQEVADAVEAAIVKASGDSGTGEHVVRVKGRQWTLQHPFVERFEEHGNGTSLMDCRFGPLVTVAMEQGAMFDGEHRVWIDRGVLQWEEIA